MKIAVRGDAVTGTQASKPRDEHIYSYAEKEKSSSSGIAEPLLFFRLRFLSYSLKLSACAWFQHQFKTLLILQTKQQ
jgi:hypothetical protein